MATQTSHFGKSEINQPEKTLPVHNSSTSQKLKETPIALFSSLGRMELRNQETSDQDLAKKALIDIINKNINNNSHILNALQLLLTAAAKEAKSLGVEEKSLIDCLSNIIHNRFLISMDQGDSTDISSNSSVKNSISPENTDIPTTPIKIEIKTSSRKEDDLNNPNVVAAVEKLLSYRDEIEYQKATGRAAKPVDVWIQDTLINSGRMTIEELRFIPMWAYRQFNPSLYQAIFDKKRAKQK